MIKKTPNIISLHPRTAKPGKGRQPAQTFGRVDLTVLDELLTMHAKILELTRTHPDLAGDLTLISSLIHAIRQDFKDRT